MSVIVQSLQGGKPLQVTFSDNFNRVDNSDLGSNWIRLLGNNNAVAPVAWGAATILTNQCRLGGQGFGNPNSTLYTGFLPVPVLNSRMFTAPRTFVQATFVSAVNIAAGVALRVNQSHEAGPITTPNGFDAYVGGFDGQTARILNGGAVTAVGGAAVANGTVRLQAENSGTSLILTSFVNSVQVNQNTILAAAFPIMRGWPGVMIWALAGPIITNAQLTLDDFSCGVF